MNTHLFEEASMIFGGSSHPVLTAEIGQYLGAMVGKRDLNRFPDGEICVKLLEPVQGRDVFLLQSLGHHPNFHIMETLIMLDAFKRASARSITLILPYFAYGRQDRIDTPGAPITARLLADMLKNAGADQLITMDLHSEQIEGFFDIPVYHLISSKVLIPYCQSLHLMNGVVVAPDQGGIKIASAYTKHLQMPLALIDKERKDSFRVQMRLVAGNVEGKTVLLPDDVCSTAGTLVGAAEICAKHGAEKIIALVAHGLFIEDALEKIEKSPIDLVVVTNTVAMSPKIAAHPKIRIVSIVSLLAEAMKTLGSF
ncbi:MAG: ribose-phosphate diphosphokinase [Parachlamydiaceae bacterium]